MRRRLTFLVAATTSAVVFAFLVPLAFLLRNLAEVQVLAASTERALTVLTIASANTPAAQRTDVEAYLRDQPVGSSTTLYLADGTMIGDQIRDDSARTEAIRRSEPYSRTENGTVISYRVAKAQDGAVYVVRDLSLIHI